MATVNQVYSKVLEIYNIVLKLQQGGSTPAPAPTPAPVVTIKAPDGRDLVQTFSETFDTFKPWWPGIQNPRWRTIYKDGFWSKTNPLDNRSLPSNGELQLYVDPSLPGAINPFRINNGMLEIVANRTPSALVSSLNNYQYTSGLITTQPSFNQLYGYFEARLKLPSGKGLWPAFWLLATDTKWPPEIDIMESIGDASKSYWANHSSERQSISKEVSVTPGVFHVFSVAWDPSNIIYYIDNVEVGRVTTPWDCNKPMFMLLNLAVGGNWPGAPDATTVFPAVFTIDYVKAYQFANFAIA